MARKGFCRDCNEPAVKGHCDRCKALTRHLSALFKDRPLEPDSEASEAARREAIHRARVATIPTRHSR